MEGRLSELLSANLPEGEKVSLLPDNAYTLAIMRILLDDKRADFGAYRAFRAYIGGGDGIGPLKIASRRQARMGWQLASKLADLMDQYEVRRPEIVEAWLSGAKDEGGEIAAAEGALARALWGEHGFFPPSGDTLSLRQLFARVSATPPTGPQETVYFFGESTLSLLQARILAYLAQTHEVVFYHNNVCLEYWGDLETKAERIKRLGRATAEKEDIELENPLLRQWGAAGRETMRLLVDLEEETAGKIDFEWMSLADETREKPSTLLGALQESICHRSGMDEDAPHDSSVRVIGAPGIRREVEAVYDAILASPSPFSGIAVLVPDMAKYRPMIESVFDARGKVPYGMVDTSASDESKYLSAFLSLADIARHGLNRKTLFAVLENPVVMEALSFRTGELEAWKRYAAEASAFDGFEERQDGSKFNWEWALQRLRLPAIVKETPVPPADGEMPPPVGEGDDSALRFSWAVELVYRNVRASMPETAEKWLGLLAPMMDDLLKVPKDSPLEAGVRAKIFMTLSALDDIPGEKSMEFVFAALEQFVGALPGRKGGYLTHGVTVAQLHPMRPVPFREVYVLGLGESGFPGRVSSSTLDVRGAAWRLGDVTVPKSNRYLFLEMLMAVRERLVLSFANWDMEKDAELFPSPLVRELCAFAGILPEAAPRPAREPEENADAATAFQPEAKTPAADEAADVTSPRTLAQFVKSPFREMMRARFGIAVEGYMDTSLENDFPLSLGSGQTLWGAQEDWIAANGDTEAVFRKNTLAGAIPGGFLGKFAKGAFDAAIADAKDALIAFAKSFDPGKDEAVVFSRLDPKPKRNTEDFYRLPPEAVLEKFFSFVASIAKRDDGEWTFRIGVLDFDRHLAASWGWKMSQTEAADYLSCVAEARQKYALSPDAGGRYVDAAYKHVAKAVESVYKGALPRALSGPLDCESLARAVENAASAFKPASKNAFNNSLVVEESTRDLRRLPTAGELASLFDGIYLKIFSGEMQSYAEVTQ